jgi:outer membrane protein assembly factor BamB
MTQKALFAALLVAVSVSGTRAADWPAVYGPKRDGTSDQKGLLRAWPKEGPKVLWSVDVGPGFGGAAISDGKAYLLDRDEKVGDRLRVFDVATGKELWSFAYDAPGTFMFPGSRTTPTVDGDRVYTSGPLGDLYCLSTTTRKPIWRKNIWTEFGGGELPRWAVVQHPLVYGNLLLVAPQTPQAGVVAYDKLTGALKWKSPALPGTPSYVSPSIVKIGGTDQVVMITASVGRGRTAREGSVVGLDPATGRVLWTWQGWQNPIPVPQPVDAGDGRLLITGGYQAGTVMIKVDRSANGSFSVTEVFRNPEVGSHTQPPILHNGTFYSHKTVNERNDGLVAMGMDGQVKWKTDTNPPFVRGGMVLADGMLIATDGNTKVYLIDPSPSGFKPLASAVVFEPGDNWAPVALADGRLLVRGQKQLKALQVAPVAGAARAAR